MLFKKEVKIIDKSEINVEVVNLLEECKWALISAEGAYDALGLVGGNVIPGVPRLKHGINDLVKRLENIK